MIWRCNWKSEIDTNFPIEGGICELSPWMFKILELNIKLWWLQWDSQGWEIEAQPSLPSKTAARWRCALSLFSWPLFCLSPACRARKLKKLLGFWGSDTQWQKFSPTPQRKLLFKKKKIGNCTERFMDLQVYKTIWRFVVCRLVALRVQSLGWPHHYCHHSLLLFE